MMCPLCEKDVPFGGSFDWAGHFLYRCPAFADGLFICPCGISSTHMGLLGLAQHLSIWLGSGSITTSDIIGHMVREV